MSAQKIQYSVPITESMFDKEKNSFLIRGVAINETTTRNGHKFIASELSKSAETLRNKPILKDHENKVDSIVGRTTNNVKYDAMVHGITYEADIKDAKMREMISDGRITSVSVGASITGYSEELDDDGNAKAVVLQGIDFLELSLVAIPADPNANVAKAIFESYESVKASKKVESGEHKCPHCPTTFTTAKGLKDHIDQQHGDPDGDGHDGHDGHHATDGDEAYSLKVKEEEKKMADALSKLDELKAKNAALELEIAEMKQKNLIEEKAKLESTTKGENKTQGKVARVTEEDFKNYVVSHSEFGKGYALTANWKNINHPKMRRN